MVLDGAAALVTGGGSGIGAATVTRLRAAGARVAVLDMRPGSDADVALAGDVGDEATVVDAIATARDELGGLDVAVLSAGVGGSGRIVDLSAYEWDRVQRVNLRGAFLCLRECGRVMTAAGGGSIVAITSISGFLADRFIAHYSTSKAALAELVRVAARELGPHGVRVNAVAPGTTDTPMFTMTDAIPGYRDMVSKRAALGRLGTADDIAAAVVALAQLEWVTGQVLVADGGISLWSPIDVADARPRS